MRICIITNSYPLTPDDFPGIFNRHFAYELKRQGHDVYVFTPDRKGEKERDPEVPVRWFHWLGGEKSLTQINPFNPVDLLKSISLVWSGSREIVQFVQVNEIDSCLAMWAIPSGFFAYVAKKRCGIPYIVWSLGADIWMWARYPIASGVIKNVLTNANLLFADGRQLAAEVEKLSGRTCEFLPTVRKLPANKTIETGVDKEKMNFLFIGRLERAKGVDILLEAANLLLKEGKELDLYIWGVGNLESRLAAKILEYGIAGNVYLKGYAPPAVAASYLRVCDCLVIPSRIESIPVVLSDAMQVGTPVIVSDVGDMGSLVREYDVGKVVKPEDPVALKEAMQAFTLERNRRYRENIERLAREFDLTRNVQRYVRCAEAVLASKVRECKPEPT